MSNKKIEALKDKFNLESPKKLDDLVKILSEVSTSKFTGSVDVDVILNLKESQKKESLKGSITLPNQFQSDVNVIVLADEADAKKALKAGANEAGLDDLKKKILDNEVSFDVLIATPSVMSKIVDLGKVLGPKGLMPNPKNGTIATDVESAVKSFKAGKLSYKMEPKQGVVRSKVAKLDMKPEQIAENVTAFLNAVTNDARKFAGSPIKKVLIKPTMGPSIKLDFSDII